MGNEKYNQYYENLAKFREKEVKEGLSIEEHRKMESLLDDFNEELKQRYKKDVNVGENQRFDDVKLVAIRNFAFEKKAEEQTFWEKITKKEPYIYYELIAEDREDIQFDFYTYEFALDVRDFLKEAGLERNWIEIVPPIMDMSYEFKLAKEEMDWIKKLPDPEWCFQMINEIENLEDKAESVNEDMHEAIIWLKDRWREGYQIYIDYTELSYITID